MFSGEDDSSYRSRDGWESFCFPTPQTSTLSSFSSRESSTIASGREETELVCHRCGCCSSLLCGHSPCRTAPLTKKGSKNGSLALRQNYECHPWVISQRISLNRNYLKTKVWITSPVAYLLNLQGKNQTRPIHFCLSSGLELTWARSHANPASRDSQLHYFAGLAVWVKPIHSVASPG